MSTAPAADGDPGSTAPAESEVTESTAPAEETNTSEAPVSGGIGVSIELAGLPVGGGGATPIGDSWCEVLFWPQQLPQGVELVIEAVKIFEEGAELRPNGCEQAPPCVGSVIAASGSRGCAVLVRPPSAQTPSLTLRLDGTLRCPDEEACEAVGATEGAVILIENPGGGEADDGSGAGEDVEGAGGEGTGEVSSSAGARGAAPSASP